MLNNNDDGSTRHIQNILDKTDIRLINKLNKWESCLESSQEEERDNEITFNNNINLNEGKPNFHLLLFYHFFIFELIKYLTPPLSETKILIENMGESSSSTSSIWSQIGRKFTHNSTKKENLLNSTFNNLIVEWLSEGVLAKLETKLILPIIECDKLEIAKLGIRLAFRPLKKFRKQNIGGLIFWIQVFH
uniref:Uncharacterized protein n=1 Tax=Meloidogyne enterolobii TaxID=390850 RepID=A0A6V7VIL5_MELEN|nr:unnamed protein product [Meloidogyne enterolobii]